MRAIFKYLLTRLRTERRKTLPLFCAILLASVVISIFALALYTQHKSNIEFALDFSGSHHFVINEPLTGEQLELLRSSPEVAEIRTEGEYTYVNVAEMKKVYAVSESLAGLLGLERNGYGTYNFTYNRQLLGLYGIKDAYYGGITALGQFSMIFSVYIFMVMILFAVMINGAYATYSRSRISELGLLKSIGATPGQISGMLYLETLIYSIPAIITGTAAGYLVQGIINRIYFSVGITLVCALCVILTVLLATSKQIRRLGKIPIVSAISGDIYALGGNFKARKKPEPPINPRHPARSLALQFYRSNRTAFKMSVIAMTLFFSISFSFLIFSAYIVANTIAQLDKNVYNITINSSGIPEEKVLAELASISDKFVAYYSDVCTVTAYGEVDTSLSKNIWQYNGKNMLHTIIYGLDEISYRNFLSQAGITGIENGIILVNNAGGTIEKYTKNPVLSHGLPLGDLTSLTLQARTAYDFSNDIEVTVPIAAVTDIYPEVDSYFFPYDTVLIMPFDEFERIYKMFNDGAEILSALILIQVPVESIEQSNSQILRILSESGIKAESYTRIMVERSRLDSLSSLLNFCYLMILFLSLVGLMNVVNSINASIAARRRELSALRSIGMDRIQIRSMFIWEASVYMGFPLIISLPITCVVTAFLGLLFESATFPMVLSKISYAVIFAEIAVSAVIVFGVYLYRGRQIGRE